MKRSIVQITASLLVIGLFVAAMYLGTAPTFASEKALSTPNDVVVKQAGKHALKLKWKKVKGAKGYYVYKARPCLGGYKIVKDTRKASWKDKSVKPGRTGTYKVRAYMIVKGEEVLGDFSYPVSAKVCTKKSKRRNADYVYAAIMQEDSLLLGFGEAVNKELDEFVAKVKGPEKKIKGKWKEWDPINYKVRWYSTDPSIVKVKSATDIVAGNKPGKCYVYAIAHNGVKSKGIPVTVKDFAYEKVDIKYASGELQVMFNQFEDEIREICSYYSKHRVKESYTVKHVDGELYLEQGKLSDKTKLPLIMKVQENAPFEVTDVQITPHSVKFLVVMGAYAGTYLIYTFDKAALDIDDKELSPHWWERVEISGY